MPAARIKPRERDAIIQALRAGVVPRLGLQHIQVGRSAEIKEMLKDIERISDGGAAIRFIIGEYGSGKTFFLTLTRLMAMQKGLVVMSADLAPDRRLYSTTGQARMFYAQMVRNTSTRTRPDGGAVSSIVERFIGNSRNSAEANGVPTSVQIREDLKEFEEHPGGFDFAHVVGRYWRGFESGNDELQSAAVRWLRAEYTTKTEARKALGVRTIVDDKNWYDRIKLFALFVRAAGYKGLLVTLDELVNLYKLPYSRPRTSNYEQILRILNDVLQSNTSHIGFLMGGTPEFLMDPRRGLYSYEALQSRLAENTFAGEHLIDLSGPIIRLTNLTPEELYVLLFNIRRVMLDNGTTLPDQALQAFMKRCDQQIGNKYFRTPRNTVKEFVSFVSILQQNPGADWRDLVQASSVAKDDGHGGSVDNEDDELASFKL